MIKYNSIEQFRHTIHYVQLKSTYVGRDPNDEPVYDESLPLPTLTFEGTVKLHGTNAGISWKNDGSLVAQSRTRELSVTDDNIGFAKFVHDEVRPLTWVNMLLKVMDKEKLKWPLDFPITLYGEWCGKGIMKGVALSSLPDKIFVIFGIRVGEEDDSNYINIKPYEKDLQDHSNKIYNIHEFPTYKVLIDFNNPKLAQEEMADIVNAVELECPVGKQLGVIGVGEGVVWTCLDKGYESSNFKFKVKGAKHKLTKDKTKKELTPEQTEQMNSVMKFLESVVTDVRLEQGIESLKEMGKEISNRSTGDFIKWISNDVVKEEYDIMKASDISQKDISKPLGIKARVWFQNYLNAKVGL